MSTTITLLGRLGNEPELRIGQSGTPVTKLNVVTSGRKNVDGKWIDVDTTWWTVVCFRQLAERVAETLHKGTAVIVHGTARQVEWEHDGQKRSRIEVTATTIGPDLRWADTGNRIDRGTAGDSDWGSVQPEGSPF